MKITEEKLAELGIKFFEEKGYETYKEVLHSPGGKRADIIAIKDNYYINIEVKTSLNLTLLNQVFFWKDKCHECYVLIPTKKIKSNDYFAKKICEDYGIGVLLYYKSRNEIMKFLPSSICNDPEVPKLYEEQKDSIAGTTGTSYVTPFKITVERLKDYINDNGEDTLNNAMKQIKHHYRSHNSAKYSIRKMIDIGVIPELKVYKKKNILYVCKN